ncbi:MAG TPA: type 1 glutamine amidotransferase [Phycisphaerae bacterium]|nr:type 1 glutamine amidotransferase [Phycisphaerae bacterium]
MNVLVIMHAESEGPGTLGEFLIGAGATVQTARLHAGDRLPPDPREFDALVSMGGPMNVYEEARYPFLRDETEFLREAIRADVPTLGICLGAQMIAKACGARVVRAPQKEVGWSEVTLTDAGVTDPLFHGQPRVMPVFQWHEDMFEVPAEGTLLATSTTCPHQAFRCGSACGLQFHIEVTREMLANWFAGSSERTAILRGFDRLHQVFADHASRFYESFVSLKSDGRL